jgi:hypothetical protein
MLLLRRLALLTVLAGVSAHAPICAQKLTLDRPQTKSLVSYLAQPATVEAGKPSDVEFYFRIADGLHINSHAPSFSEMIPTTLSLQPAPDVKLGKMQYPAGTRYAFNFAPNEKLSVYTGDFVVKVSVTAAHAGRYTLNGLLNYQACDNLQCYPVKTLPVSLMVTAK